MFAVRGIAVSFSTFFLVYTTLSLAVCVAWRAVANRMRPVPARTQADSIFWLRMLPLAASVAVTAGFAIPSFLILEPRLTDEALGVAPLLLGICGAVLIAAGVASGYLALVRTARALAVWSRHTSNIGVAGSAIGGANPVPLFRTSAQAPPLTASGIFRPGVWLSKSAESLLSENELSIALRHEMAHIRRRDNLKKLILRAVAFPGLGRMEDAWREVTEMAADDAAVSTAAEALDLAAAVIKLSRVAPARPADELTAALVSSQAVAVNARVERLLAWDGQRASSSRELSSLWWLGFAGGLAAALIFSYSELLVRVHMATEWMVR